MTDSSRVSGLATRETHFWRALKSGQWPGEKPPEYLDVPEQFLHDIEERWTRVVDDAEHKELGACIVFDSRPTLRFADEVTGESSREVCPKCRTCERSDHLGFFHTHWLLDGDEQVGFSHLDFAGVLEDGECLSIVCSGEQVFALLRTEKTPKPAAVSRAREREFLDVFIHYIRKGLYPDQAARKANHDLCRRLGLAFYAGRLREPLSLEVAP